MIEKIKKIIAQSYSTKKDVIAIYLYGSVLRSDFNPSTSDIDVLIFMKDVLDPISMYDELKQTTDKLNLNIDLNIIFESEFNFRSHPGWSRHFFFDIKHSSELIFGSDIINTFKDAELSFDEAYRRITELTQRLRFVYLNNGKKEEVDFWLKKYTKWLMVSSMEFLALLNLREFEPKKAFLLFLEKIDYPQKSTSKFIFEDIHGMLHYLEYATRWLFKNKYLFTSKTYDAIIFDLGQTLMDSDPVLKNIDEDFNLPLWQNRGFKGTLLEFRKAKKEADYVFEGLPRQSKTNPTTWSQILAKKLNCVVSEDELVKEVVLFNDYYLEKISLMPHVGEILSLLKKHHKKIILISNGWKDQINSILDKFEIRSFFDKIYISESEEFKKSELKIFSKAIKDLNLNPDTTLMVGDRPDEDGYSKKIGIDYAWFRKNPHYLHIKEIEPCDYILDDLMELEDILNQDE